MWAIAPPSDVAVTVDVDVAAFITAVRERDPEAEVREVRGEAPTARVRVTGPRGDYTLLDQACSLGVSSVPDRPALSDLLLWFRRLVPPGVELVAVDAETGSQVIVQEDATDADLERVLGGSDW